MMPVKPHIATSVPLVELVQCAKSGCLRLEAGDMVEGLAMAIGQVRTLHHQLLNCVLNVSNAS